MGRLVGLALLALLAAAACRPRAETGIFRCIAIGPLARDTIRLGASLAAVAPYVERLSDSSYQLRPGTFAGADSIELRVTPEGLVKEIRFTYRPGTRWSTMVQAYAASLGSGKSVHLTEGRALIRWTDRRTYFSIGTGGRAAGRITGRLIDLRLAGWEPYN
jgi:hypothetical protein